MRPKFDQRDSHGGKKRTNSCNLSSDTQEPWHARTCDQNIYKTLGALHISSVYGVRQTPEVGNQSLHGVCLAISLWWERGRGFLVEGPPVQRS